jgi:GntR family transcriptional regulator/MocR family aminotransferase
LRSRANIFDRKAAAGQFMQIPVLLDRSRREPLTSQLVEQLRDAIRQARLSGGTRLPSSRQLSRQLAVSRNTVVRAYDLLILDGYVESRPASGVFVCDVPPDSEAKAANDAPRGADASASCMPMPSFTPRAPNASHQRSRLSLDFVPRRASPTLFPIKLWRRLLQNNLSHGGAIGLSQYSDPAGLPALRSSIANHLALTRRIAADPSRIIIVSGAQEGISIAARLFLDSTTLGAVEEPCRQGAAFAFEATGCEIASIPVDYDGLIPQALPRRLTALIYVTPSHQFPTGHTLSPARRDELVSWARSCGCYILEDDCDSDLCYEGSPLQAIAATAPDCTIYLGTFSRTLGAGLRLGYMVVPAQLAGVVTAAKGLLSNGSPWLEQAALAEMISSNSYAAHLTRVRAHYKECRDALLAALRRNFGEVSVSGERSGLHLLWYLPPGVPDAAIVENVARAARIGVYSLASAGAYVAPASPLARRGLILGFATLLRKQIDQGIARLSDAIDDAVDDLSANISALFATTVVPLQRPPRLNAPSSHLDSRFRRQPALSRPRHRDAGSPRRWAREMEVPMAVVSKIYRYPVKGLSAQPLSSVAVEASKPLANDRVFALVRPGAPIDSNDPQWAKKGLFVMLMLDEGLARVSTQLDVETLQFTATLGNRQVAKANLASEADRASLGDFFWQLLPALPAPPVLVRSRSGHFMDKPDNVISLINLATVRSLEEQWGYEINPLRFRANIYVDGPAPWEEFDWIGSNIRIGGALFTVDRKNGRCGATNVNPLTGRRDLDIPGSLRAGFGHKNLGVYLTACEGGRIAVGDELHTQRASQPSPPVMRRAPSLIDGGSRSFICRGCYFIYEEAKGLPQLSIGPGTSFADIPASWSCPDCGTEKATFRPHVNGAAIR